MMGDRSKIAWTEATWNPIVGCSKVSAGCDQCYAIRDAHRMAANPNPKIKAVYEGLTVIQNGRPNWSGEVRFLPDRLDQPLRWKRPRRVFVNSMSDLAHEGVTQAMFDGILHTMVRARQHTYQILTKRPERLLSLLSSSVAFDWEASSHMPAHIWLGASVENKAAQKRIPTVAEFPAQVRWLSLEPLLEPLPNLNLEGIDWVVIGGESGLVGCGPHSARPMEEDWVEEIIAQCREMRVPGFVKQMGSVWAKKHGSDHRAGAYPEEWPPHLRMREYPDCQ